MPKYVTRMAKSGESESYAVKDTGARELIGQETEARAAAVTAEAEARAAAVTAEAEARAAAVTAEADARAAADTAEANTRAAADTELKNNLIEEHESIKQAAVDHLPVGKILENTWLNADGEEETANGWGATDFIKFKAGDSVIGIYTTVNTNWVWFYDASKETISNATAAAGFTYIAIPSGAVYVRVSNTDAGMATLVIYDDNKTDVQLTNGYLNSGRLIDNVWLNASGVEEGYVGWSATGFIELPKPYKKIITKASDGLNWNWFYDENKAKIGDRFGIGGTTEIHDIPDGAKYVRFSGTTATVQSLEVFGDSAIINKLLVDNLQESNNGYPVYYNDQVLTKVRTINSKIASSNKKDAFVFVNDIHYPSNEMKSPALVKDVCLKTGITKVILNGDYINKESVKNDAFVQINRVTGLYQYPDIDTFITVGNHEYNNPTASDDPADLALQLSQDELRWPILHRNNRHEITIDSNSLSYYFDDEEAEIRYLIGTVGRGTGETLESLKWIANQLQSVPSGYGVVVIFHTILTLSNTDPAEPVPTASAENLVTILEAAKNKTTLDFYNVTYDYTQTNYDIICALCGDYHLDMDYTTTSGVKIIATTTDSKQQWYGYGPLLERTPGTITEQAFDVVTIDRQNKKVFMTRIGAGSDREFSYT